MRRCRCAEVEVTKSILAVCTGNLHAFIVLRDATRAMPPTQRYGTYTRQNAALNI